MDTPKVLSRNEAIDLVKQYKRVITPRFAETPKVYLYGSYSKGHPGPWSDIDVAVVVNNIQDDEWLEKSADLWHDIDKVSILIEPVLIVSGEDTMLYQDILRTGVAV